MRSYSCVLAILGLLVPAFAQITITQGNFPPLGTSFGNQTAESTAVTLGSGGINQTWTIPDHAWVADIEIWTDPATTPYAGTFPAATHCITMSGVDSGYIFLRVSANGVFFQGVVNFDEGEEIIFEPDQEAMFFPLPLTYPATWTTLWHVTIEPQPGFFVTVTDSIVKTVDGWGTLVTPFGSWPVLRIQSHEFLVRQMTFPPVNDTTEVYSYMWISADVPVGAEITSYEDESNPNFTQGGIVITTGSTNTDPLRGPLAQSYYLEQNHPNPFNPETQITFDLHASGDVSLKVYNLLGEEIATLVKGFRSAGRSNVAFNAAGLGSGTYLYQLQMNGHTETKRMTLLK